MSETVSHSVPAPRPERVLLIQLRRAGDVVVSTALLEDLHRAFPGVHCDWMVGPAAASLLEHHPLVAERIVRDPRDLIGMSRDAKSRRYDWIIDVQGSWRTAAAAAFARSPVRVGWTGLNRSWAYSHRVVRALRSSKVYVVRDRERLLAALGVPVGEAAPRLHVTAHERARAERRLRKLAGDRPLIGMVISTSDPRKDWPAARFAELAQALTADGVACVVFPTPGAAGQEAAYVAAAGDAALLDRLVPLRELVALIGACDVFVSGDTGPAHIATALGVPRVTVYGPTPAEGWTPDSRTAVPVRDTAARCAACAGKAPQSAHTCLDTVTAAMVLGPVRELLGIRLRADESYFGEGSPPSRGRT